MKHGSGQPAGECILLAGMIASKESYLTFRAVERSNAAVCKSHYQKARFRITESRDRLSPVDFESESARLGFGHMLPMGDQSGTEAARYNLALES